MEELIAEPELEEIEYQDDLSYVCSCFVMAYYKHGGMFGNLDFSPNEFSPKDFNKLAIFDKEFKKSQECIDDNPDLPYFQLILLNLFKKK